jgi:hypothetical protein
MPSVRPLKLPSYEIAQSPTPMFEGAIPMRAMLVAPGSGGKTTLLSRLILDKDKFRGVWDRIYIFSRSCKVDDAWGPVKKFIETHLGQDPRKEEFCFDHWDEVALLKIIDNAKKLTEYLKKEYNKPGYDGPRKLFQTLVILDDMAADREAVRSKVLEMLYVRGRWFGLNTIVSTQKLKLISPTVRTNLTHLFCFRLRNASDLIDGVVREFSALLGDHGAKLVMQMYRKAVDRPYGFLFINMLAKSVNEMFFSSFQSRLVPRPLEDRTD